MPRKKSHSVSARKNRFKKPAETAPVQVESIQTVTPPKKRISFWKLFFLCTFLFLFLAFAVIGTLALSVNQYIKKFEATAGIGRMELLSHVKTGLEISPLQTDGRKNILLLGVDALSNREGEPVMTDTIMVLSLHLETGKLSAVSLPRDLWHPEQQTKINALYHYGKDRYPDSPQQFSSEVLSEWIGVPIHHTIVVSLEEVAELIDLVGGVEVEIKEGFIDERFPRSDVDVKTETDPDKLYETVMFTAGSEVMSGQRALKYIRSRKSTDVSQGTDDARAIRQQQIIASLIEEASDPAILKRPDKLGKYFAFYRTHLERYVSLPEIISTGYQLREEIENIEFTPTSLSIEANGESGVLSHPPVEKYGQWVYEANDLDKMKHEVHAKLGL